MALNNRVKSDLITAMKAGEALRVSVLRMLISEMNYKQIDLQRELTEEDVVGVVQKEVKKRKEAIQAYTAGGRPEQAETERQEMEILQAHLPQQLGERELEMEIEKILLANSFGDFGAAMKVISPQFKGRAEGAEVARIVRELIVRSS